MKRWVGVIPDEQYNWIKETMRDVGVKGAYIIQEALAKAQKDKSFKDSLMAAQVRWKLDQLAEAKAKLEDEIQALKQKARI